MSQVRPIEDLFAELVELKTAAERDAYLDEVCRDDAHLRIRLEKLLAANERAGSFLRDGEGADATADLELDARLIGTTIGPYKIREVIGEGGMGTVYVAEQEKPLRRKVALKVIKAGMDSKAVIARFEAERNAMALMNHPHIAKVLDAGTTDQARPFFAMELVSGIPITDYCDQHKLSINQRLELFVQVCRAIQHAHQKGIIHRDIKPSNVLVTELDGRPVPKVIDFGVAKALNQSLTDRSIYTSFQSVIGTPLYMSPEQASLSAVDVDTRSDIYSLGVLLYELLTGTTPFEQRNLKEAAQHEVLRIIREEEPPRPSNRISTLGDTATKVSQFRQTQPSQLGRLVKGDLDWIVMTALAKDRSRRYGTADSFTADISRHLVNEPVEARPPSRLYTLSRFASRNKIAVTMSGLLVAVVLFGMTFSFVGFTLANREAKRAVAFSEELERILKEYTDDLTQKGLFAAMSGDLEVTEEIAAKLRLLDSTIKAEFLLGVARIFRGEHAEAVPCLENAGQSLATRSLLAVAYLLSGDVAASDRLMIEIADVPPENEFDRLFSGYSELFRNNANAVVILQEAVDRRPTPLGHALLALALAANGFDSSDKDQLAQAREYSSIASVYAPDNAFIDSVGLFVCSASITDGVDEQEEARLRDTGHEWAAKLKRSDNLMCRRMRLMFFDVVGDDREYAEELAYLAKKMKPDEKIIAQLYASGNKVDARQQSSKLQEPSAFQAEVYFDIENVARRDQLVSSCQKLLDATDSPNTVIDLLQVLLLAGEEDMAQQVAEGLVGKVNGYDQNLVDERVRFIARHDYDEEDLLRAAGDSRYARAVANFQIGVMRIALGDEEGARKHLEASVQNDLLSPYRFWTRVLLVKIAENGLWTTENY